MRDLWCVVFFIISLRVHLYQQFAAAAVVIDSPSLTPQTIASPRTYNRIASSQTSTTNQFRIRKTKSHDIDAISTMLTMASVTDTQSSNWKHRIKCLGIKSSLTNQLYHRLNAVEEGIRTMSRFKNGIIERYNDEEECLIDSETTCHLLWSNDNFRNKIKSAVLSSSERTAWEGYNFDSTPQDVDLFKHLMLTVIQQNNNREEVVGFCEVAWLPRPNSYHSTECSPSIVNLVTSTSHRRKGIASKLIDIATKYASTQWLDSSDISRNNGEIGLYVHPENETAICLYHMKGFHVQETNEDGMLYMSKSA